MKGKFIIGMQVLRRKPANVGKKAAQGVVTSQPWRQSFYTGVHAAFI